MKLAMKLSSLLILGMVCLLTIDAFLAVRRETVYFRADMEHDAKLLGHTMRTLIADTWNASGERAVLRLIDEANRDEDVVQIRWVWLDGTGGESFRPEVQGSVLEDVAAGVESSVQEPEGRYDGRLVTYVPIPISGDRLGALELSESMSQLQTYRRRMIARSVAMMGGLLAVSAITITVLGTLIVGRPLGRLVERVRRIGHGDLQSQLHLRTGDELSELATALNRMCCDLASAQELACTESDARIAALEQLRHADRLATVGRLASGIAHEIGTPLNVISARAKQIENALTASSGMRDHATIIGRQSERITAIIRQLLAFARPSRGIRERTTLCELTRRVVALLQPLATKHHVTLLPVECTTASTVDINRAQMEHVLANLIDNAIQAMPDGGDVTTEVGIRPVRSALDDCGVETEYAYLAVKDQGVGISGEALSKVFDPFFTTKDVGEGTGLGLSLAFGIVREHEGWIDVTSEPNVGSCFTVFLPAAHPVASERDANDAAKALVELTSSDTSTRTT